LKKKSNPRSTPYEAPAPKRKLNEAWTHDKFAVTTVVDTHEPYVPEYDETRRYTTTTVAVPPAHQAPVAEKPPISTGSKVMITNLDPSILVEDIHLLCSNIGPLKKGITLHYNAEAGSIAEVTFTKREHAELCIAEYNNRKLDDRVMKVHMLTSSAPPSMPEPAPSPIAAQTYQARTHVANHEPTFRVTGLAQAAAIIQPFHSADHTVDRRVVSADGGRRGAMRGGRGGGRVVSVGGPAKGLARGGSSNRGGRNTGRGGWHSKEAVKEEKPKTAEDLDSMLMKYKSGKATEEDKGRKGTHREASKSGEDLDRELAAYREKKKAETAE
jgi:hypothetical protein